MSILQPPSIGLRSRQQAEEAEPAKPEEVLPYTPLSVLTVDGLDPEQIWAQLELRNEGVCKVVKEVGTGEEPEMDEDEEGGSEEDDSEEMGSDEEMSVEEWNRMMAEGGYEEGDSASGSDEGSDEEDSEEGSEVDSEEDDTVQFEDGTRIGDSDSEMDEDDDEEDDEDEDEEDEEDDEEEGDDDEDDEDDDEEAGNPDVDMDDEDGLFPTAGPSKRKKAKHPTLDDEFFSIDDFNRMTEEQEAERVTSGRLGGDEEDDEPELDDFSSMFLASNDNPAEMTYADFFAPPERAAPSKKGKGKDVGKKKPKKAARFEDSEDEDEEEPEEEEEVHDTMDRVKTDLFEDSEDEGDEVALSTHEKRQRELAEQIAELEQQAIGPKDWTLMGEASSRARPENSLLEENLDFEHVAKAIPVITEESVATLEELIKKRILDVSITLALSS